MADEDQQTRLGNRVPPHSLEAENAVLGAVLIDAEALDKARDSGLLSEHFYIQSHQKVFDVALTLAERGAPADLVTVSSTLRDRGWLEVIGGMTTLTRLYEQAFVVSNIAHYSKIIQDKALLRKLIQVASDIIFEACEGVEDPEAFADESERKIFEVAQTQTSKSFSPMRPIVLKTIASIQEMQRKNNEVIGLHTGFRDFDRLTGGLRPGQLIVLAARPAMGKTSLFMSMAQAVGLSGEEVVAIFSLEMSQEELCFRMISGLTRINSSQLKVGHVGKDCWPRVTDAANRISKSRIFIDDSAELSVVDVRSRIRRLRATEKRIDLIVVDYLQLMRGTRASQKGDSSREREISEISRGLKALAKEQKVPIIALSQLNRSVESRPNKRPQLSDLRECVVGETPVDLADGQRLSLAELVGTKPWVRSVDLEAADSLGWRSVQAECVWEVGKRAVFSVITARSTLTATAEHRFITPHGWATLDSLKPGDCLGYAGDCAMDWEAIVGIEPAGERSVYDLTVPGTQNWLSHQLVSHNSGAIEQDSDMVCFIYRDEVYDKDTKDRGIAELIVAKHRAGETATVRLAWLPQYTLFDNLPEDLARTPIGQLRHDPSASFA